MYWCGMTLMPHLYIAPATPLLCTCHSKVTSDYYEIGSKEMFTLEYEVRSLQSVNINAYFSALHYAWMWAAKRVALNIHKNPVKLC